MDSSTLISGFSWGPPRRGGFPKPFADRGDGRPMARAVVNGIREPVLLLDRELRVVAANEAYCLAFNTSCQDVHGRPVWAVNGGRWDSPGVAAMLARILARTAKAYPFEVQQDMPGSGRHTLLLHARESCQEERDRRFILLAIEDVSERRAAERESARLLHEMETLLLANQHQIANSLQVIASILLLKAQSVQSRETRTHLENVHWRILSVATVQRQLLGSRDAGRVALAPYLTQLCETLAASMVAESRPVSIDCRVAGGKVSAGKAVSMGLIVTELVINALKHAFIDDRAVGRIAVTYDLAGDAWRLAVSDDGIGECAHAATTGLGTSIVEALVSHLDSFLEVATSPGGTTVTISHRTRHGELSVPPLMRRTRRPVCRAAPPG
jgi:two-component sensor histidine kinase